MLARAVPQGRRLVVRRMRIPAGPSVVMAAGMPRCRSASVTPPKAPALPLTPKEEFIFPWPWVMSASSSGVSCAANCSGVHAPATSSAKVKVRTGCGCGRGSWARISCLRLPWAVGTGSQARAPSRQTIRWKPWPGCTAAASRQRRTTSRLPFWRVRISTVSRAFWPTLRR